MCWCLQVPHERRLGGSGLRPGRWAAGGPRAPSPAASAAVARLQGMGKGVIGPAWGHWHVHGRPGLFSPVQAALAARDARAWRQAAAAGGAGGRWPDGGRPKETGALAERRTCADATLAGAKAY